MQYSFKEIHALNLLNDNPEFSKRFNIPFDLKLMTIVVLCVIAAAITGAILFKVDKIVPAQGVLETRARLFDVRSTQAGFIDQILVEEGQHVAAGDTLVRFDTEQLELEIARLEREQQTLARSIWTEFYQIHAHVPAATRTQLTATLTDIPDSVSVLGYDGYLARTLNDTLAALTQKMQSIDSRKQSTERQLALTQQAFALEQDEFHRLQRLVDQGIENRVQLEQQRKRLLELEGNQESLRANLLADQHEQDRLQLEREQRQNEFVLERLLRLHEQRDQYEQVNLRLAVQQRTLRDQDIRAPFAAVVDAIAVRGQREVLDQGATLVQLRPLFDQDDLEIDIQIPSNYAVWVEPGMTFRASSLGNNPDDHGYIHGYVDFVSESTDVVEGQRIYRMKGRITEINLSERSDRQGAAETFLRPGLQLSVEVKAGERRLINYIFDPFTKYLRTALREPS
ncbi:HlyD family efflux transporter periplasmic adaptor subunit [Salinispirillum marinum]|uniref:HlyD family efflux transporter periplasmic adaptor subunit n=2 Tax=Saccharospirillaceae TaxID=255527 RepID=A0ABV8BEZ4_9GAMM